LLWMFMASRPAVEPLPSIRHGRAGFDRDRHLLTVEI
jgi:hypothetical protein